MFVTFQHHLHFIIFVCIFSCLLGQETTTENSMRGFLDIFFSSCRCRCGVPNREGRFKGGEHLKSHEFPWMSSIQILKHEGEKLEARSVPATLINNKYVLTGASPLMGLTPYQIKVTIGLFDKCAPDLSSSNVSVDKIIIHSDYSAQNRAHDIALVKLSRPVHFERRVSPICLSYPGHNYLGQVATVVGWPPEGEASDSCRPRKLGLPILDKENCLKTATNAGHVSEDKGCIGVYGTPSIVCTEDAGTPVMYRSHAGIYDLIGVLTDQNECEEKSVSTALYTKINAHLSWITKNTKDACYCLKT